MATSFNDKISILVMNAPRLKTLGMDIFISGIILNNMKSTQFTKAHT